MGRWGPGILALFGSALALWGAREQFQSADVATGETAFVIVWANVFERGESLSKVLRLAKDVDADIVLIAETPNKHSPDLKHLDTGNFEYQRGAFAGENSAISLFSRKPVSNFDIIEVNGRNGAIFTVKYNYQDIAFSVVHPTIPLTPEKIRMRNEHILTYAEHLKGKPSRVMIGDFNTAPWSPVITQSKSVAELRRLSPGISSTWLSTLPLLGLPIDHVLLGGNVSGEVKIGKAIGSDHFPIIVGLSIAH